MASSRHPKATAFVGAVLLYVCCLNAYTAADSQTDEVHLRTDLGWVRGRIRHAENGEKYASFRGVPYGKPPVGALRFKELESMDAWDYLFDATEDGPACPQKDIYYGRIPFQRNGQSENCTNLNLHVPYNHFKAIECIYNETESASKTNETEENLLPILVFIHGGVFQVGSGLTDLHGPEYLMTKDVIVISFNYRLNVFGFLSLNSSIIPGNQGLRDQIALLRWVQANAKAFGGDPDNVTLMGQSAGASSAHLLSLSEATEGLFHRLILMSGNAVANFFTASPLSSQSVAELFLTTLGINSTDPDRCEVSGRKLAADYNATKLGRSDPEYIHEQLIQMPLNEIMYANDYVQNNAGLLSFGPTIETLFDGVTRIIDDEPLNLIAAGRGKNYPMLLSYTDREVESFKWVLQNLDILGRIEKNPLLLMIPRLVYSLSSNESLALASQVKERYSNGTLTVEDVVKCYTDILFKYPALKVAEWRASSGAPTYLAQYAYESQQSVIKESIWLKYEGAAHVEDLTYVFRTNSILTNHTVSSLNTQDALMRDWLPTLITNFMKCSNTTCSEDESDWPPVSTSNFQYQNIVEPMVYNVATLTTDQQDMITFFDTIDSGSRNLTEYLSGQK